jgi:hypothetical protein
MCRACVQNVLNESLSILLFKASFDDYVAHGREVGHMTAVRALVLLSAAAGIGVAVGLACCRLLLRIPTLRLEGTKRVRSFTSVTTCFQTPTAFVL